jgi:hypothetical protein
MLLLEILLSESQLIPSLIPEKTLIKLTILDSSIDNILLIFTAPLKLKPLGGI